MGLTHIESDGNVTMVDVGGKKITSRKACARGSISMSSEVFDAIISDKIKKGNVFATARIAGIMAAKNTANTIPLCHPLPIDNIAIDFFPDKKSHHIEVQAEVKVTGRTGVEMEALHAASIALLTIYDMCKAMDRTMVIKDISLTEKSGGKSGHFVRQG
ncbi:MAG: cyclic pyranopterin monophosphate synthase MoaC [Deltaproteobacteria bacterium]|nr:cyclic pyranopterin monophosphate synthase MoaC [Deltaproteobacteria bacterium]